MRGDRTVRRLARQPGGERGEDRDGLFARFQPGQRRAGGAGDQLGERDAVVVQRRGGHTQQGRQRAWQEAQARHGDPAGAATGVRHGVGPRDQQLRARPHQVHAAVGQHLVRAVGGGGVDPAALHEPGQRGRGAQLAVAHGPTVTPDPDRIPPSAPETEQPPGSAGGRFTCAGCQEVRRTASISRVIVTLSPTTTPPPSSGIEMSTPKSLRLIVVVAEKPARVPP